MSLPPGRCSCSKAPSGEICTDIELWTNPSWQLSLTQPLAHQSGRNWKGRSEKTWLEVRAVYQIKEKLHCQSKEFVHYVLWLLCHLQEFRASSHITGRTNAITPSIPFFFFSHLLLLIMMLYDMEYPLGPFRSTIPAVSLPSLFCSTSCSLAGQCEEQKRP